MVYALGRLQNPTLRHSLTSQQFHCLSELITLQTNISLRGAYIKTTLSLLYAFFNSFSLETDFFFAIFEQNPKCTTERNQMNPINTVSIQVWCPDITELSFEESVTAKPDLPVFRLSDGIVRQNLRQTFKRLMFDTGLLICPHIHSRSK